jgi:hypothetical protein
MHEGIVCQGRLISAAELGWLRDWIDDHRQWSRHQLAVGLCRQWQWSSPAGRLKNYAARSFLMKLERRGFISLPPVRETMRRQSWIKSFEARIDFVPEPITAPLEDLLPVTVTLCSTGSPEESLFRSYLATHHYLGFGKTVGENLQYLVRDRQGRDLACLLFGSAAWKVEARDHWIEWSDLQRQQHLITLTNNTRFLVLPWIKVPHLASHILGKILRRLSNDWEMKYGHPIHLVETFVEQDRFRGTCYQAANWIYAGETKGRSRQDRNQTLSIPVKDVYLYPLHRRFREALC